MRDSASRTPAPLRRNLARASSPCPAVVKPCPSLEPLPCYGGAPAQASSPCHVRMQPCPSLKPLPCYCGALPRPQASATLQCCPCLCQATMPLPRFSAAPALSSLRFSPPPAPPLLQWCCPQPLPHYSGIHPQDSTCLFPCVTLQHVFNIT